MILERIKTLLAPKVSTDAKLTGISLFFGKTLDKHSAQINALGERQLERGETGDKGESGRDGRDGKDGKDGKPGRDGKDGRDGKSKDGKDGKPGKDGVSVIDAEVDFDRHLRLTLSSGKILDAGEIPVEKGSSGVHVSGNAWQITVSSTAPENPQIDQLWLDIS